MKTPLSILIDHRYPSEGQQIPSVMAREIIYWRGTAEIRLPLVRALQGEGGSEGEGFEVTQLGTLAEITEAVKKQPPFAMIVDASGGEREVAKRLGELAASVKRLAEVPIVFLASKAQEKSESLAKQYRTFRAVNVPFKITDVFSALESLESVSSPSTSATASATASAPAQVGSKKEPEILIPRKAGERDPGQLISSHGGKLLTQADRIEVFDDNVLLPKHPQREVMEKALDVITKKDMWAGVHARRTAYASSAVANSLALGPERDKVIRTVGLLLNWGLMENPQELLRKDFFLGATPADFRALAEGYARSAEFIRERLQDENAARTAQVVSQLLSGQPINEHRSVVQDAQCALVSEFADRACWGNGYWNSRGAYRVMSKLRTGELFHADEQIALAIIRMLGEAVSSRVTLNDVSLPGMVDRSRQRAEAQVLEEATRESEKLFGVRDHVPMSLYNLKPGMLLARPMVSAAGRVVVRANTQLDDDIIKRLWQLAAVVPLRLPAYIVEAMPVKKASRL